MHSHLTHILPTLHWITSLTPPANQKGVQQYLHSLPLHSTLHFQLSCHFKQPQQKGRVCSWRYFPYQSHLDELVFQMTHIGIMLLIKTRQTVSLPNISQGTEQANISWRTGYFASVWIWLLTLPRTANEILSWSVDWYIQIRCFLSPKPFGKG